VETDIETYYWQDLNRWSEIYPNTPNSTIQEDILDNNDAALACFYARDTSTNPHLMQSIVMDANIPRYLVLFAAIVPNADIKALQSLVIKGNNTTAIIRFARYVSQANVRLLETAIAKSKNPSAAVRWLKTIPQASVKPLQSMILSSTNPNHLLELARHIKPGKTLKTIEDRLVKGKHIKQCRLLAQIKGANTKRLERVVLNSGDLKQIKLLAKQNKASEAAKLAVLF
jgi:hypothetical protein